MRVSDAEIREFGRMWGLPVQPDGGRGVVQLGRATRLCAWTMPAELGRSVAFLMSGTDFRPAIFHPEPGRLALLGEQLTPLRGEVRRELAELAVDLQDSDVLELPDPGCPSWVAYSVPGREFPDVWHVVHLIRASDTLGKW